MQTRPGHREGAHGQHMRCAGACSPTRCHGVPRLFPPAPLASVALRLHHNSGVKRLHYFSNGMSLLHTQRSHREGHNT
jgi:hypothetical protein